MRKKKTQEEYISEVAIKNPNVEVIGEYIDFHTKIMHHCLIHDIFWEANPFQILKGCGCQQCRVEKLRAAQAISESEYVQRLSEIVPHVNLIGKYTGMRDRTLHYCTIHDFYWDATPTNLLRGCGCKYCGYDLLKKERIKSHEKYIEDLYAINPNIIALETYKGANIPILHKCLIDNNEWSVRPAGILFGFGCPVCNESHGEKQIRTWLNAHNIQYESQYIFDDCKDKKFLPFDFYLPDLNLCVEYDGEQHFKSIDFFGGEDGLQKRQLHDKIKTEYCQNNNISLLRIKYDENIEDKLNNFIHLI